MATKYLETGIKQITETLKAYINIAQSMPKIQYKSGASNCIYSIKNALMFPNWVTKKRSLKTQVLITKV
jgi:hypothetical protein